MTQTKLIYLLDEIKGPFISSKESQKHKFQGKLGSRSDFVAQVCLFAVYIAATYVIGYNRNSALAELHNS